MSTEITQDARDDLLLSLIRQIVREEIRQALAEEAEADAARCEPRIVKLARLTDASPDYFAVDRTVDEP